MLNIMERNKIKKKKGEGELQFLKNDQRRPH